MIKRSSKSSKLMPIGGFPELQTKDEIVKQRIMDKIKKIYRLYGFVPMDTRLVEFKELLEQKGIDTKEVYSLDRLHKGEVIKKGEKQQILALRFDLTVPLARYIAQNHRSMSFPFKRYQIQKVYRGETAKSVKGRYNEFYQADIDVIGMGKLDLSYDSEFPAIIYNIFKTAIGIERFIMRINNRKLLEGLFFENGISDVTKIKRAIKVIDDIEKVSIKLTLERLNDIGLSMENAKDLLELFRNVKEFDGLKAISHMKSFGFTNKTLLRGITELEEVVNGIVANGVPLKYFQVDLSIARGLDYYTGTVYETTLLDAPELGSVCSGGRYDDLVSVLSGNPNDKFQGVGISIGLSRLVPSLIKMGYLQAKISTVAQVLVTCQDATQILEYQRIGGKLRNAGINTDVYLNRKKKFTKQLTYASNVGYKHVIIANKSELEKGEVIVRNMQTKKQFVLKFDEIVSFFTK